ncbi:MAG: hypothetical protein H6828_08295 [Planctomycetes bacterium]|nr:hypothetical protein [Planctomycetota bacterium]
MLSMLRWALLLSLLFCFFAPSATAQNFDKLEASVREKNAKALNDYAEDAFKQGFPKVAKKIWLMLLSEYDPDNASAHKALGEIQQGGKWIPDPEAKPYPKDDNPDVNKAKALKKKWEAVAHKVAGEHMKLAAEYDKAGRTDKSRPHYEKVVRFEPDNETAQQALDYKEVAGLSGTDLEQKLYERSKLIERAVAEEAHKDYPVERLPDSNRNPLLDKANVSYISVKSEHFIVRGDFDEDLLKEAAVLGERAMRVMEAVASGYEDRFSLDPRRWITDWAFFQDQNTYIQVVNSNKELIGDDARLKFITEQTRGTALVDNEHRAFIDLQAPNNAKGVEDGAVRNVAQDASGFVSVALREGIGHTVVGMMFNNNRAFIVDRETQQRTSTGEEDVDAYSPNMDTWKDLAVESAWRLTQETPAGQLPLIKADKFTDDARIKAWSFVDYMVRRDPGLLHDLDKLGDQGTYLRVQEKFNKEEGDVTLQQLEKEWKDFWTEASPVLKAIRNNTEPLSAVTKEVKDWLGDLNEARKERGLSPVTWSSDYSGRCRSHVEYLLAHEDQRGPDLEQHENIDLDGGTHLGDLFAQMAIVDTDAKKPKDSFRRWLDYPGYRDVLLNYTLRIVGLYVQDDVLVMDVMRGIGQPEAGEGGLRMYPDNTAKEVPTSVKVADLGPELKEFLTKHGQGGLEVVGYPISLHRFGIGGVHGEPSTYQCQVEIRGQKVEGLIHIADGGSNRHTSAPGLIVFYPLAPLPKGGEVKVKWVWQDKEGNTFTKSGEFRM